VEAFLYILSVFIESPSEIHRHVVLYRVIRYLCHSCKRLGRWATADIVVSGAAGAGVTAEGV